MKASGVPPQEIAVRQAQLERRVAGLEMNVGGGCPGKIADRFRKNNDDLSGFSDTLLGEAGKDENPEENWSDSTKRKWKKGVCQVKACGSPKPTEVGPCSVCKSCQKVFDEGGDPTQAPALRQEQETVKPGALQFKKKIGQFAGKKTVESFGQSPQALRSLVSM